MEEAGRMKDWSWGNDGILLWALHVVCHEIFPGLENMGVMRFGGFQLLKGRGRVGMCT
jgi:hypothetical protein